MGRPRRTGKLRTSWCRSGRSSRVSTTPAKQLTTACPIQEFQSRGGAVRDRDHQRVEPRDKEAREQSAVSNGGAKPIIVPWLRPRGLTHRQAAAYFGLSVAAFD